MEINNPVKATTAKEAKEAYLYEVRYGYINWITELINWNINSKCKTNNMFKSCPIKNEYKPKMLRMNEAFDFNSIKDTRSIDALKTIEKLQHEQDFIDVPKIKGPELAKLKGFVAGM